MFFAFWVNNLDPLMVHISGNFGIHYYGVAYLMGFLGGAWLLHAYACAGRSQLPSDQIADLIIAIVVGVMVGGRLGSFFLYDGWARFPSDPFWIFRIWEGGMASHGGFIGVALALAWFSRGKNISFFHLGDLIVSVAPVGLFFGRIANFINGELWGKISVVPWAVIFPLSAPDGTPVSKIPPRHPSQLYEAALEGLLLLIFMQWRFWRTDVTQQRPGRLSGEFLTAYAVLRTIGEMFREPDSGINLICGLSRGTFYSVFLMIVGLMLILRKPGRISKQSSA